MLCCGSSSDNNFPCEVVLLDEKILPFENNINFKKNAKAQVIFDAVCDHLNLAEKDYFGLRYQDKNFQTHWLDLYRSFREHEGLLNGEGLHKLYFGVKFFVADPTTLREEITRYQFFLQLKQDILSGRLECDFKKATELAALSIQSELGDFQRREHQSGYASEFRFVENQDVEFENEVERLHRGYAGLVPSEAEMIYLRKCRQLDMYGLDIHPVQDEGGIDYMIGLSAKGVEVRKNKRKVKVHYWPLISHIEFKDRQLKIQVKNKNCDDSVYTFVTQTRAACKYLWKRAIEQHAFFRLVQSNNATSSTFVLGKKFRYSGRTASEMQQEPIDRDEPVVLRSRSKRYPSRNEKTSGKSNTYTPKYKEVISNQSQQLQEDIGIGDVVSYLEQQTKNSNENILAKSGLFGTSEQHGVPNNYITPKSERRQRNRELRSLSDSENKHRKSRSRHGKSSGEESDSPSKRRIRARNRKAESGSEAGSTHRRRRRQYHTDTEMVGPNAMGKSSNGIIGVVNNVGRERNGAKTDGAGTDDGGRSDTRSHQSRQRRTRKKQNRLSREDAAAQQVLWQHINKETEDPAKYTEKELEDIPYTAVKTEGNPLPIKLRRHSRGHNSPAYRRTSRSSSTNEKPSRESSTIIGDGLVSPLPITTTVRRDKVALGNSYSSPPSHLYSGKHRVRRSPPTANNDWDTKTKHVNGRNRHTSRNKHRSPCDINAAPDHVDSTNRAISLDHSTASTQV